MYAFHAQLSNDIKNRHESWYISFGRQYVYYETFDDDTSATAVETFDADTCATVAETLEVGGFEGTRPGGTPEC